jgi:hypothetical protein
MGHGVRVFFRRLSKAASVLAMLMSPIYAEDAATSLFKVITVKDEIVIGLSAAELVHLADAMQGRSPSRSPARAPCLCGNTQCGKRLMAISSRRLCGKSG